MDHAFFQKDRIVVRRRARCFKTATLIDCDVDQHGPALHRFDHVTRDQFGRGGTRHEHSADDEMRPFDGDGNCRARCILRLDLARKEHVEFGQPVVVDIVNRDIGAHADGHLRGVDARNAATKNRNTCRRNTRHTAKQHAASTLFLFKVMRPDLNCHPARHFRHRLEQRQLPGPRCHGFISDAGCA